MRDRIRDTAPIVGIWLLATLLTSYYALRMHTPQPDEFMAVIGARGLEDDFFGNIGERALFVRGFERLTALVMWLTFLPIGATPDEMRAGHVVLAACLCATVFPAYGIARLVGLGRMAAAAAGGLTIVSPWLVFGVSWLNVTTAVPTSTLLLWAALRAELRPGWRGDVLVLATAALAIVARPSAMAFLIAIALVAVVMAWRERGDTDVARSLMRRHPILAPAGVLALLVTVVLGPRTIAGPAYERAVGHFPTPADFYEYGPIFFTQLSLAGLGIAMAFALPWLLREAVRPGTGRHGAFAVLALGAFVAFTGLSAQAGSTTEERYVAVLAVLPAVAFVAALADRRRLPWWAVGGGLAVVAAAVRAHGRYADETSYANFIAPARQFYDNVLLGRISTVQRADLLEPQVWALLGAAGVVAVLLVLLARHPRVAVPATLVTLLVAGAAGGAWAMRTYTNAAGSPQYSWEELGWLDAAAQGRPVTAWRTNRDGDTITNYLFDQTLFFNRDLRYGDVEGRPSVLTDAPGPVGESLLVLVPPGFQERVVRWRQIARSTPYYGADGLRLMEVRPAVTLATVTGTQDGRLDPGDRAVLEVRSALVDLERSCFVVPTFRAIDPPFLGASTTIDRGAPPASVSIERGREIALPRRGRDLRIPLDGRSRHVLRARSGIVKLGEVLLTRC